MRSPFVRRRRIERTLAEIAKAADDFDSDAARYLDAPRNETWLEDPHRLGQLRGMARGLRLARTTIEEAVS